MSVDRAEVALLRLAAQRLSGPGEPDPTAAVRRLAAMQAQDLPGALTSVALRSAGRSREAVVAALDEGKVVRSWPMRGTLHLVTAPDLPWMLRLLAPRVVRSSAGRRTALGLTEGRLEQARGRSVKLLSGGGRLTRAELFAGWRNEGLDPSGQRGVHLLGWLAMTGVLVLGPMAGREQQVVLLEEWITDRRSLERDEALGELGRRYFCGHGPATCADLARWANLTVADTRAAVALARPSLVAVQIEGVEHLMDPETPERLAADRAGARATRLLPGFDELLLGYADRSATVDPAHADAIVPGGNGMFRATVLDGGRVVGTWSRRGSGARQTAVATGFPDLDPAVAAAVPSLYAALP